MNASNLGIHRQTLTENIWGVADFQGGVADLRYYDVILKPLGDVANDCCLPDDVFVEMPTIGAPLRNPNLERLLRKFDPVERDFRNRRLGRAGEEFVVHVERRRLVARDRADLAGKVRWVAVEDGDGAGFDVLSFDATGEERFIEVKTTNGGALTPFFMTRNELAVAEERADRWHLHRVHLFAQRPAIYSVRPPLEASLKLHPET